MPICIPSRDTAWVIFLIVCNIVSVVGIIGLNKALYGPPHNFRYPTVLMCLHFFFTWAFVLMSYGMGHFTKRRIPVLCYALLGFAQCGSVALVNLSLMYNTVGVYQILKFSNVLVICAIEYCFMKKVYAPVIYASLVAIVVGVTFATVSDVGITAAGLVYGILGSLFSATYQIYNKVVQASFEVNSMQLLMYEQPFSAFFTALFALFTDNVHSLATDYRMSTFTLVVILTSGVFAFGVNVTVYSLIGKTSPVTYSVVGHTKTVLVLLYGFVALREPINAATTLGLLVALGGIVAYTHFTQVKAPGTAVMPNSSMAAEDPISTQPSTPPLIRSTKEV